MTKAAETLEKMKGLLPKEEQVGKDQPEGSPIGSASSLKANDNVTFKAGHELEGELGRVAAIHPERNTVDLKLGSGTRVDVPVSDLLLTVARSV